jgi:hypothetical protein
MENGRRTRGHRLFATKDEVSVSRCKSSYMRKFTLLLMAMADHDQRGAQTIQL